MSNPIIKITCYKNTGKYYTSQETELKDIHYSHCPTSFDDCINSEEQNKWIDGKLQRENYEVTEKLVNAIRSNSSDVLEYAPVTSGFAGQFHYVIEVLYPDGEYGFCNFHLNKTFFEPMAMPA